MQNSTPLQLHIRVWQLTPELYVTCKTLIRPWHALNGRSTRSNHFNSRSHRWGNNTRPARLLARESAVEGKERAGNSKEEEESAGFQPSVQKVGQGVGAIHNFLSPCIHSISRQDVTATAMAAAALEASSVSVPRLYQCLRPPHICNRRRDSHSSDDDS